jgi:hypothetical protein
MSRPTLDDVGHTLRVWSRPPTAAGRHPPPHPRPRQRPRWHQCCRMCGSGHPRSRQRRAPTLSLMLSEAATVDVVVIQIRHSQERENPLALPDCHRTRQSAVGSSKTSRRPAAALVWLPAGRPTAGRVAADAFRNASVRPPLGVRDEMRRPSGTGRTRRRCVAPGRSESFVWDRC